MRWSGHNNLIKHLTNNHLTNKCFITLNTRLTTLIITHTRYLPIKLYIKLYIKIIYNPINPPEYPQHFPHHH